MSLIKSPDRQAWTLVDRELTPRGSILLTSGGQYQARDNSGRKIGNPKKSLRQARHMITDLERSKKV